MRWIKASERLPKQATGQEIVVRYKGGLYTCKCIAHKFVFREGAIPGNTILGKDDYENIEWLDESNEHLDRDENSPQGKAALGFYQWINSTSMSHADVPLHIKYRMYADQQNAETLNPSTP